MTHKTEPKKLIVPFTIRHSQDKWLSDKIYKVINHDTSPKSTRLIDSTDHVTNSSAATNVSLSTHPVVETNKESDHSSELSFSLIIYQEDRQHYQVFELTLILNHIQCRGHDKNHVNSYFLTCQGYHGVTVINHVDHPLMRINQHFILFSQKTMHHTTVMTTLIKNKMSQSYYPIYVICCHHDTYTTEQFVSLFPYLTMGFNPSADAKASLF